jgi:hypothetical protein
MVEIILVDHTDGQRQVYKEQEQEERKEAGAFLG